MGDLFLEQLNEKYLASYYLLPLLELSKSYFGEDNFIDAYQTRDGYQVVVLVVDVHSCFEITQSEFLLTVHSTAEGDYMVFQLPERWYFDYRQYCLGKYSKMSVEAKQKIRELSGLKYGVVQNGIPITDALLMVLDRNPALKQKWMEVLDVKEWNLPEELLSPPAESSFINLQIYSNMDFGTALIALKEGKSVSRTGWNGKGLKLKLQVPDANSKMTLPYIYMEYPSTPASDTAPSNHINARVPWLASQTDVLAEDWQVID
jgi:hypothetical protein